MDFTRPFRAITPTLDGPVLRVLAGSDEPMNRQQISDVVGDASEAGVRKVLRRLAEQGMAIEQRIGSQYTYVANRDHIIWPAVDLIVSANDRLDARVRNHVQAWVVQPLSIELFGSAAIGEATAESDVDLIVYRPHVLGDEITTWDEQVAELRAAVERWTGNPCEVLDIDAITLIEMAAEGEPVLGSTRVHLSGLRLASATPDRGTAELLRTARTDPNRLRGDELDLLKQPSANPALERTIVELGKASPRFAEAVAERIR